jgi:hypothetical protein
MFGDYPENTFPFVNLTPEEVVILSPSGEVRVIPTTFWVRPRVRTIETPLDPIAGIPVAWSETREVVDLPPRQPGWYYIVPPEVGRASRRADILFPGEPVRDDAGSIIGYRGLLQTP